MSRSSSCYGPYNYILLKVPGTSTLLALYKVDITFMHSLWILKALCDLYDLIGLLKIDRSTVHI